MAEKQGTPLAGVTGISSSVVDSLAELWLTTAEELVSAARQAGGEAGLVSLLGLPATQVEAMVNAAVDVLPADVSFDEEEIIELSLGALPIEDVASPDDEPVSFADLPQTVDLRSILPAVRNQGDRGTCVAHAAAAVREFLTGASSTGADLSEQFLYWACKQRDGHPSDFGTWIKVAMAVLHDTGVCPETVWPYNKAVIANNEGQGPPPASAQAEAAPFKVISTKKLEARWLQGLKEALADGQPVAFSVSIFQSWQNPWTYRNGDIRLPLPGEENLGGHAMCMVGYADDHDVPGGGYFIVRNSWGEAFGQQGKVAPGYCRLPYAFVQQHAWEAFTARL
ncbi:MAG TPA: C1 family peptidase [Anaerolineae bacterium]|nr:C1 family peptidase [Anaerolineae bacterium]